MTAPEPTRTAPAVNRDPGVTHFAGNGDCSSMVAETERDDGTWFECEECGLMFDDRQDARKHEAACDAEDPPYIQ